MKRWLLAALVAVTLLATFPTAAAETEIRLPGIVPGFRLRPVVVYPAVGEAALLVVPHGNSLTAVRLDGGGIRWEIEFSAEISAISNSNFVVAVATENSLFLIDERDGSQLARGETDSMVTSLAVVPGASRVFAAGDKSLSVFSIIGDTLTESCRLDGRYTDVIVEFGPAGPVGVAASGRTVVAVDTQCDVQFNVTYPDEILFLTPMHGGIAAIGTSQIHLFSLNGSKIADIPLRVPGRARYFDVEYAIGATYVAVGGSVYAITPQGSLLWRVDAGEVTGIAILRSKILLISSTYGLFAVPLYDRSYVVKLRDGWCLDVVVGESSEQIYLLQEGVLRAFPSPPLMFTSTVKTSYRDGDVDLAVSVRMFGTGTSVTNITVALLNSRGDVLAAKSLPPIYADDERPIREATIAGSAPADETVFLAVAADGWVELTRVYGNGTYVGPSPAPSPGPAPTGPPQTPPATAPPGEVGVALSVELGEMGWNASVWGLAPTDARVDVIVNGEVIHSANVSGEFAMWTLVSLRLGENNVTAALVSAEGEILDVATENVTIRPPPPVSGEVTGMRMAGMEDMAEMYLDFNVCFAENATNATGFAVLAVSLVGGSHGVGSSTVDVAPGCRWVRVNVTLASLTPDSDVRVRANLAYSGRSLDVAEFVIPAEEISSAVKGAGGALERLAAIGDKVGGTKVLAAALAAAVSAAVAVAVFRRRRGGGEGRVEAAEEEGAGGEGELAGEVREIRMEPKVSGAGASVDDKILRLQKLVGRVTALSERAKSVGRSDLEDELKEISSLILDLILQDEEVTDDAIDRLENRIRAIEAEIGLAVKRRDERVGMLSSEVLGAQVMTALRVWGVVRSDDAGWGGGLSSDEKANFLRRFYDEHKGLRIGERELTMEEKEGTIILRLIKRKVKKK